MPATCATGAIHQDHMTPFHQAGGEAYLNVQHVRGSHQRHVRRYLAWQWRFS
jgi:hypothetical protein